MIDRPLLDRIREPADVKSIPAQRLPELAGEIRAELLEVISRTGGHLASNLGAVELTLALLRVFDLEHDRMIWDTSHQAYVYKLLTGRRELFQSLRQDDGCCGFLHREESRYDHFGAGHAGTAISAALGFAAARDFDADNGRVLAIVGDGALGCGISLEGLNSIIETSRDFILVINDNKMSIAPNVGAMSKYLSRLISDPGYNRIKQMAHHLVEGIPSIGPRLRKGMKRIEEAAKSVLVPGVVFEELGLRYIGPLDGHDIRQMTDTFRAVAQLREPIVLHVLTEKGRGYPHAEQAPEIFHGTSRFDVESGQPMCAPGKKTATSFSSQLGNTIYDLLRERKDVVAVTAGMCHGTGLARVREDLPERFFDVGIAEEHAVVFAAGMAAAGMHPVVAVYATFMQRAVDYVFHDVSLQKLPVVFCLDRAGIVADGPTHHGIHDIGFWRAVPNISILQPADGWELDRMLNVLIERNEAGVIRYPKANASPLPVNDRGDLTWGESEVLREGGDAAIWAVGREALTALEVADLLADEGLQLAVVNVRFLLPFDADRFARQASEMPIVTLENHCMEGGFAGIAAESLQHMPGSAMLHRGWPREVIPWGTESGIRKKYRMDAESLAEDIRSFIERTRGDFEETTKNAKS